MNTHVEEILRRELHEVADGLQVPVLPQLPEAPPRTPRPWHPMLVAAAVVLIAAGAIAVVTSYRGGGEPQPAPSPTETTSIQPLTSEAPTVPYVLDGNLYVDGAQVPGGWWAVQQGGEAWVAQRTDNTWWWGTDAEPQPVPGQDSGFAQLSPDGSLFGVVSTEDGGQVLLVDTRSGEAVGVLPIDVGDPRGPDALVIVAVTDDGLVFLQGSNRRLMWPGPDGDEVVDLQATEPDQWVGKSTPAGLVVRDGRREGRDDASYLAEPSDDGTLTRLHPWPSEEGVVNPSGTWLAYGGSWGGESVTIPTIAAQTLAGDQRLTLEPPDDRDLSALAWEDDDLLLAGLYDDGTPTGLARCSIREARCVVVDAPLAEPGDQ